MISGFIFILSLCFCNVPKLSAQTLLKEIPLKQQIEKSTLVVEGKVISKTSFWDADHHNIYTSNTIEVYKVFKGAKQATIEVVTPGGSIGLRAEVVTPSLKLHIGDMGVFTLYDNSVLFSTLSKSSNNKFEAYSSLQGFYKYNIYKDVAVNTFSSKSGITKSFYSEIMHHTKTDFIEITPFDIAAKQSKSAQIKNSLLVPDAFTFFPTTSSAGTASVLTITGSNFGTDKGQVYFSNADDGGATLVPALDTQVLTWSDIEITVEIPTEAGTGPILVIDSDGWDKISDTDLIIPYAQLTAITDPDDNTGADPPGANGPLGFYAFPVRHVNNDGSGGYIWKMTDQFKAITGAEASFVRAMDTWRCETKINWVIDAATVGPGEAEQHRAVDDGVNIIAFDDSTTGNPLDDLPDGIAGRCSSYYLACGAGGTDFDWFVGGMDIVFDDEVTWEYGPKLATVGAFDFESVALHELGHGHQLGHVIQSSGAVMHWVINDGENIRTLTTDDNDAANDMQSRSEASVPSCFASSYAVSPMVAYPGVCTLDSNITDLDSAISIYPNPTTGAFFMNNSSSIKLDKAFIYDVSGRLIFEQNISNTLQETTVALSNVSKGIYFVNIHSGAKAITKKIVLE